MAHKVLIIDDDPEFIEATSNLLDAQGYIVVSAPKRQSGNCQSQRREPEYHPARRNDDPRHRRVRSSAGIIQGSEA